MKIGSTSFVIKDKMIQTMRPYLIRKTQQIDRNLKD